MLMAEAANDNEDDSDDVDVDDEYDDVIALER